MTNPVVDVDAASGAAAGVAQCVAQCVAQMCGTCESVARTMSSLELGRGMVDRAMPSPDLGHG